MVSLGKIILDETGNSILKSLPSEEDHTINALGLQTPKPPFHVCVQVRVLRWQQDDFSVRVLLDEFPHGSDAVVSIEDEVTGVFEKAVFTVVQVPADLLWSMWMK